MGGLPIIALVIFILIVITYFIYKKKSITPQGPRILTATTSGNIYGHELINPANNLVATSMLNTINQAITGTWTYDNVDTTFELVVRALGGGTDVYLHTTYKPKPGAPVQNSSEKYDPISYMQILPTLSFATQQYSYTIMDGTITFTPTGTTQSYKYTR